MCWGGWRGGGVEVWERMDGTVRRGMRMMRGRRVDEEREVGRGEMSIGRVMRVGMRGVKGRVRREKEKEREDTTVDNMTETETETEGIDVEMRNVDIRGEEEMMKMNENVVIDIDMDILDIIVQDRRNDEVEGENLGDRLKVLHRVIE